MNSPLMRNVHKRYQVPLLEKGRVKRTPFEN